MEGDGAEAAGQTRSPGGLEAAAGLIGLLGADEALPQAAVGESQVALVGVRSIYHRCAGLLIQCFRAVRMGYLRGC